MTIKTFIATVAVAAGIFASADRADAQWRRGGGGYGYNGYSNQSYRYTYPTYSYPTYSTSPGVVYSSYSAPMYYTDSGVVVSGYNSPYSTQYSTPYSSSYYGDPYSSGVYGGNTYVDPYAQWNFNNYTGGYTNLYGNGGVGIGTRGAVIGGRRIRW